MENGNCLITVKELGFKCHIHPQSVLMHRAGARHVKLLEGLPGPVRARPFLLWLKSDIEFWLDGKSTLHAEPEQTLNSGSTLRRKPGRPKKTVEQTTRTAKNGGSS